MSDGTSRGSYESSVHPVISAGSRYSEYGDIGRSGDISLDGEGNVWVSTGNEEPLRCIDRSGTPVRSIGDDILPSADGIAFGDDGILWVSDTENDLIYGISLQDQ